MKLGRNPQSLENERGAGLGRVTVVALHGLLELAEALHVEVLLAPSEQRLLLDHRLP